MNATKLKTISPEEIQKMDENTLLSVMSEATYEKVFTNETWTNLNKRLQETLKAPEDPSPKKSIILPSATIEKMTARAIMEAVTNPEGWKFATLPVMTDSEEAARKIEDAISYYCGGAEVDRVNDETFIVTSLGYYHYIGA